MKKLALFAAVLLASACAKSPEKIAAADVGQGIYRGNSCKQLASTLIKHRQNLDNLSAAQRDASSGDTVGVLLLGLPLSSMSGNDKETSIAVSKGHIQQIEAEQVRKGCAA